MRIYNKDGCGGWLKVVYPNKVPPAIKDAESVFIDIGLTKASNTGKCEFDFVDYANYVKHVAGYGKSVLFVVPDSWDLECHLWSLTWFVIYTRRRGPIPNATPILVTHYLWWDDDWWSNGGSSMLLKYVLHYRELRMFGYENVAFGIPVRRMTLAPGKVVECRRDPMNCGIHASDGIARLSKYVERPWVHLLGLGRAVARWIAMPGDGVTLTADTDAYRLAVDRRQRYHVREGARGPGLFMVGRGVDPCEWFKTYVTGITLRPRLV